MLPGDSTCQGQGHSGTGLPAWDSGEHGSPGSRRSRFLDRFDDTVKRALDILISALLLIVLSPVFLVVAIAIKVESRGPVFYRANRVGRHGRPLAVLKFRKMADGTLGSALTVSGDDRLTRVGRFLAEYKLDELPQLWNVLRGDMSIVGPRPEAKVFVELQAEPYAREILMVRPGMTGLTQLAFAHEGRLLEPNDRERDYRERLLPLKVALDRLYVARRSLMMDACVLGWTVVAVALDKEITVHRETGRLSLRRRPAPAGPAPAAAPVAEQPSGQATIVLAAHDQNGNAALNGNGHRNGDAPHAGESAGDETPIELEGSDLVSVLAAQAHQTVADVDHDDPTGVRIAILAGGKGARLAPYTSVLPKPLMPVGDRAILEIVLGQLAASGFAHVTLCVGHLSHLIKAVLADGGSHGVTIDYVHESEPLGTAGPLKLIGDIEQTFIAMNGDLLTTLEYRDLLREHRASGNVLTIATHARTVRIDYGVLHVDHSGARVSDVTAYEEKPELSMAVSMGIYVIEPRALDFIPAGEYFDFPDLVKALIRAGEPVGAYRFDGYWLDIGRHEDYAEANRVWESSEHVFLQTV